MKYLLLIGDGMADYALPELKWRTPLAAADTPGLDALAAAGGRLGMVRTIPRGARAASDTAFLSILGLDPRRAHPGRGPLEAVNLGITPAAGEVVFRVNLVTIDRERLADYSAGHIGDREAAGLIAALNDALAGPGLRFYAGKSYRNIMVLDGAATDWPSLVTTAPHDISGREIGPYLPSGPGAGRIREIIARAGAVLAGHPVNATRADLGENPANAIWPWGQGGPVDLPSFHGRYQRHGATVSAVDIVKGIGRAIGLAAPLVPGATGYLDTNYRGKVEAALAALEEVDFCILHIEATDETSHEGDLRLKLRAITEFDHRVVQPALAGLRERFPEHRVMVMADHVTSLKMKTHTPDPVPFLIAGHRVDGPGAPAFSEATATRARFFVPAGWTLLDLFFRPEIG